MTPPPATARAFESAATDEPTTVRQTPTGAVLHLVMTEDEITANKHGFTGQQREQFLAQMKAWRKERKARPEITATDLAVQHQPVRPLPVQSIMMIQQQAGRLIQMTDKDREALRANQMARQQEEMLKRRKSEPGIRAG